MKNLFLLLLVSCFVLTIDAQVKPYRDSIYLNRPESKPPFTYRSPMVAFGASMAFPGMGQIYNRQYIKGAVMFSGVGVFSLFGFNSRSQEIRNIAATIAVMYWVWSFVDAPVNSVMINQRYKLDYQLGETKIKLRPLPLIEFNNFAKRPVYGMKFAISL